MATLLPQPLGISSPSGPRKRGRSELTDQHEESPNKLRLLDEEHVQKLYSPGTAPEEESKENLPNSPVRTPLKRSNRIKDLSRKLKQRTSLGGILSPKRAQSNASFSYPQNLLSSPLPTPVVVPEKAEDIQTKSASIKRRSIRLPSSDRKRREGAEPPRTPRKIPINPEITSPKSIASPGMCRSMSMYTLAIPEQEPAPVEAEVISPKAGSLTHRESLTPSKKKKKNGISSLSLRSSRKRSITDFKALFTRGSQVIDSLEDLEESKIPRRYFGADLEQLMEKQRAILDLASYKVPYFVDVCCSNLRTRFLEEDGLFRISPSLTYLEIAVDDIEHSDDIGRSYLTRCTLEDRPQLKPHVYAGLLKKFLRDMPSPLLGSENYHQWIGLMSRETCPQVSEVRQLILALPRDYYNLLECIMGLALETSQHQEKNRMSTDNLATVIGPNILWDHSITDPFLSGQHIGLINKITGFLLTHFESIFLTSATTSTEEGATRTLASEDLSVHDKATRPAPVDIPEATPLQEESPSDPL